MTYLSRIRRKLRRKLPKEGHPSGSFGKYIQISDNRGMKILHAKFSSMEEVLSNCFYECALYEARCLREARKLYPYIPSCYGVKVFKMYGKYMIGIVLQHLGNTRVSDIPSGVEMTYGLYHKLRDFGIIHNDIHSQNVMYFRGKYWVIDFGGVTITK